MWFEMYVQNTCLVWKTKAVKKIDAVVAKVAVECWHDVECRNERCGRTSVLVLVLLLLMVVLPKWVAVVLLRVPLVVEECLGPTPIAAVPKRDWIHAKTAWSMVVCLGPERREIVGNLWTPCRSSKKSREFL